MTMAFDAFTGRVHEATVATEREHGTDGRALPHARQVRFQVK
jgi:hypothetical protein